jgi:subfamily B ATP-binding cassette protein MsbA
MNKKHNWKEKISAVWNVLSFNPVLTFSVILLSSAVAILEGFGLSFIQPIFESVNSPGQAAEGAITEIIGQIYSIIGIPLNFETLIIGVSSIMFLRYSTTFVVSWLRSILAENYESELKNKTFNAALQSKIEIFDEKGPDEILNHVITETDYSSKLITVSIAVMERLFLVLAYLIVMIIISPQLSFLSIILLGGFTILLRKIIEPAVSSGERIAEANEKVQQSAQAGTKGIREVKLLGKLEDVFSSFNKSVEDLKENEIKISRNEAAIYNIYRMTAAITIFIMIYAGIKQSNLGFGQLGIFLLALYRLSGAISSLNSRIYRLEGYFAHFVRTQEYLTEFQNNSEDFEGKEINEIDEIVFENVNFSYQNEETIKNLSFKVEKGEFIGFAGVSGAGKSTIVSLIARLYSPNSGEIKSSSENIENYNLNDWRDRISIVRQQTFIFNTTLKKNIIAANKNASKKEIDKVCKIAQVSEFIDELPKELETEIGDNGIKLSGGQRQRVAIARALLKDSDFLILDEATSDLDSGLEKEVHDAIEEQKNFKGIIAIAHRLSTIKNADRIFTFHDGSIVEEGSHNQLMKEKGKYWELCTLQEK